MSSDDKVVKDFAVNLFGELKQIDSGLQDDGRSIAATRLDVGKIDSEMTRRKRSSPHGVGQPSAPIESIPVHDADVSLQPYVLPPDELIMARGGDIPPPAQVNQQLPHKNDPQMELNFGNQGNKANEIIDKLDIVIKRMNNIDSKIKGLEKILQSLIVEEHE